MKQFRMTDKSFAARDLARQLMSQHGLGCWHFAFSTSRTRLGLCVYPHVTNNYVGRIELSVWYTETASLEDIKDSILHEIAHALAGEGTGHGPEWVAVCLKIGARPVRCKPVTELDMPKGRWQAVCPNCKQIHHRFRKPKQLWGWHCLACGQQKGPLTWGDSRAGLSAKKPTSE